MNPNIAAQLRMAEPQVFIVYYQKSSKIAACLTKEREAYDLADMIDGVVDHIPLFTTAMHARDDSNIAYEYDRVRSEPSPYPINQVLPNRREGNK